MKIYSYRRRSLLTLGFISACALFVVWLAQIVSTQAQAAPDGTVTSKVGQGAGIPSACGPGFGAVNSANHGTDSSSLVAVSAVSASDIWAVGSYFSSGNNMRQTLIEHWNGSSWSVVASPNVASVNNELDAVSGTASDMWAVGYSDSNGSNYGTLTEHWNGSNWSIVSSPSPGTVLNQLAAVVVGTPTNVWAVGAYVDNSGSHTLVEKWNGSSWSVVPSVSPSDAGNDLNAVSYIAPNNVWAVGNYFSGSTFHTLSEHWNGTTWTLVASPDHGSDGGSLYGVTAISANDIWAVGNYYDNTSLRLQTLTEHWNGASWYLVNSVNRPSVNSRLTAVSAVAPNDVWAVGDSTATGSRSATLIEHWNGTAWTEIPSANPSTSNNDLSGVTAISASNVVVVGYSESSDTYRTLIETFNPCFITPTPTVCAVQFSDVPVGSTFYSNIHCLACLGIVSGYADGTFRPNNNVTRGQLAKIVSNAGDFSDNQTVQQFQDVPVGSTYFQYVGRLVAYSVIGGYPCGGAGEPCVAPGNLPYFRPNANATRAQITKIDSNAAGYGYDNPTSQQFQDVPVGSTYYTSTYGLIARSIMGGYPCGGSGEPCGPGNLPYFRPNNNATRGQTSKIVGNTFYPDCSVSIRAKR